MRHIKSGTSRSLFRVLHSSGSAQAAIMRLNHGQTTGELENEHPNSEQWLFVISGSGIVRGLKRTISVRRHSLVLIEKGELHQVKNTGRSPLVTLNFYSPRAYKQHGNPRILAQATGRLLGLLRKK